MILRVSYNDKLLDFYAQLNLVIADYPLVEIEAYNEDIYKDRKKSFKLKGFFGARANPFAALYDNDGNVVLGFYSENNSCTIDYIKDVLNHYVVYNTDKYGRSRTEETTSSPD